MSQITRYPGIAPFSREYKDVFFGRTQDIEALYKNLNVNDLVVLHGKSGMGKSSLLNAGLIPRIEARNQFYTLFIRFGSNNPQHPQNLLSIFYDKIRAALNEKQAFMPDIEGGNNQPSLWQYVKRLQWEKREEEGVLLILDQFEEIFTYPEEQVEAFREAYSEVVFNRMPEGFRTSLYQKLEEDPGLFDRYQMELDFLDYPPTLKLLMGIRSDRLSFLDRLSPSIPNILKNTYEVKPLRLQQAREAIVKPASHGAEGFLSPIFAYDPDFLERILSYLSREYSREIEPFLLQILCQHIEAWVISQKANDLVVDQEDIGDLDTVARSYYVSVIEGNDLKTGQKRFDPHEQLLARFLIEGQLIDSIHHNRISLDKTIVEQQGFPEPMLAKLVNSRIIRQEPNTVSGLSYELSHDTLLDPVLQSAQIMGNLEGVIESYYREKVDKYEQKWLETYFLNQDGQSQSFREAELEDHSHTADLIEDRVLRQDENDRIGLFPMFLTPANKIRSERSEAVLATERKKRRRAGFLAIGAGALALIALASTIYAVNLQRKESALKREAEQARVAALESADEAVAQERIAVEQRLIAEQEKLAADSARLKAIEAQEKAETNRLRAEEQTKLARANEAKARREYEKAVIAQQEADAARNLAELNAAEARLAQAVADSAKAVAEEQLAQIEAQNAQIYQQTQLLGVSQYLTYARENQAEDATVALRIAQYAFEQEPIDSTYSLLLNLATDPGLRFYLQSAAAKSSATSNVLPGASFSSDSRYFLAALENKIEIRKTIGGISGSIDLGRAKLNHAIFFPDARSILVATNLGLEAYDIGGKLMQRYTVSSKLPMGEILVPAISPDGRMVVGTSDNGRLYLWDVSGKLMRELAQDDRGIETYFRPDGEYFVTRNLKPHLYKADGTLVARLDGHDSQVIGIRIAPDGQRLATYTDDGDVAFWNWKGELIAKSKAHQSFLFNANFSPDGQYFATASYDQTANLYNRDGQLLQSFKGAYPFFQVRFSPDNQQLLTCQQGGESALWDLQGNKLYSFDESVEGVFVPLGNRLLLGSDAGQVSLWDLNNGQRLGLLIGHSGQIDRIQLSPNGFFVLTNSFDNTAKLWSSMTGPKRLALVGQRDRLLQEFRESEASRVVQQQTGQQQVAQQGQAYQGPVRTYKEAREYTLPPVLRAFLESTEAASLNASQRKRYNILSK